MNERAKAIIIDDEPEARELLQSLVNELEQVEVLKTAGSVDEALPLILKYRPEILFLDIEMPGKSGFDLVSELNKYDINLAVIFVTAFDKYAVEAIRNAAFDYLLKPVGRDDLLKVISRYWVERKEEYFKLKVQALLDAVNQKKICFRTRDGLEYLKSSDIICCRADGNYTNLCCNDGSMFLVSMVISKVEEMLPVNEFFRVSRSDIINISYLTKINRKEKMCVLSNGNLVFKLDISRANLQQLIDKLDRL